MTLNILQKRSSAFCKMFIRHQRSLAVEQTKTLKHLLNQHFYFLEDGDDLYEFIFSVASYATTLAIYFAIKRDKVPMPPDNIHAIDRIRLRVWVSNLASCFCAERRIVTA